MLVTACLVTILAFCVMWRVLEAAVKALDIDLREAMLYLGLAEHELTPSRRRPRPSAPARADGSFR